MNRGLHKTWLWGVLFLALVVFLPQAGQAARVKDLTTIEGVRINQLVGYGLVVGLNGTGDKSSTKFTTQSVINMLERLGVHIESSSVNVKNVAAVVVTADLEPFARAGSRLDVLVSSIGDSSSLNGGTLLMTPLLERTARSTPWPRAPCWWAASRSRARPDPRPPRTTPPWAASPRAPPWKKSLSTPSTT